MDRRVKYTKAALRQSLLELMETRSINKITVKELCEHADIGRGTFYNYYTDQYDLLLQVENEIADEIKSVLAKKPAAIASREVLYDIFNCIVRNSDLCRILFSEHGDSEFLRGLIDFAYGQFAEVWTLETGSETAARYAYAYLVNGSVGLIRRWVHDGFALDASAMAELTIRLIYNGVSIYTK